MEFLGKKLQTFFKNPPKLNFEGGDTVYVSINPTLIMNESAQKPHDVMSLIFSEASNQEIETKLRSANEAREKFLEDSLLNMQSDIRNKLLEEKCSFTRVEGVIVRDGDEFLTGAEIVINLDKSASENSPNVQNIFHILQS